MSGRGVDLFYRYLRYDLADLPDRSSLERLIIEPVVEAFLLERGR